MSFAGIEQFRKNLDFMMASEAFKNADNGQRLHMGGTLLRSNYGACGTTVKSLEAGMRLSSLRINKAAKMVLVSLFLFMCLSLINPLSIKQPFIQQCFTEINQQGSLIVCIMLIAFAVNSLTGKNTCGCK